MNQPHLWKLKAAQRRKSCLAHSFLLIFPQTCLFKPEQSLPADAARPGSGTVCWILPCGGSIWRFPAELVPFNQEASVLQFKFALKNPVVLFPETRFLCYHVLGDCSCHPLCYRPVFSVSPIRKSSNSRHECFTLPEILESHMSSRSSLRPESAFPLSRRIRLGKIFRRSSLFPVCNLISLDHINLPCV